MKNRAKHVPGLIALVASMAMASATAAGQSASRQDPSDPNAPGAPIRYESFLPAKTIAAHDTSPADNWKEANRTVGSIDAMSLTMPDSGEGAPPKTENPPPQGVTPQSDPHAGHRMPSTPAADPHAGHQMPRDGVKKTPVRTPAASHAGRKIPAKKVADPHAGHVMPPATPEAHPDHTGMEKK